MIHNTPTSINSKEFIINKTPEINPGQLDHSIGLTFRELLELDLPPMEYIIHCLPRGYIATLNAKTESYKSTFCRNLLICLAGGRPFLPISPTSTPRRIALLDFEDNKLLLKKDLKKMAAKLNKNEDDLIDDLIKDNLLIISDESSRDGGDLTLSDSSQFAMVEDRLCEFRPDLIIVDTIASAFRIENENDNGEIKNKVMRPLKQLARASNAALLATHHVGKAGERSTYIRDPRHMARGASSLGDHSYMIMNLDRNFKTRLLTLECGKSKGPYFPTAVFSIDNDTRWLNLESQKITDPLHHSLLSVFKEARIYRTREIVEALIAKQSARTTKRHIDQACKAGLIKKIGSGKYEKVSK